MIQTESQLEIYKIILGNLSFKDIVKKKEGIKDSDTYSDEELFNKLYGNLISNLTNAQAWTSKKTKVGLALFSNQEQKVNEQKQEQKINPILTAHSDSYTIEGFIDGGPYDKIRTMAQVTNISERSRVGRDRMLTDRYYVYLYLPLGSKVGLLLLERKKGLNIHTAFEFLLKEVLRTSQRSGVKTERFVPESIIDEYRNGGKIEDFTFTDNITTSIYDSVDTKQEEHTYGVSIKITPSISEQPSYDLIPSILGKLGDATIKIGTQTKKLSDFISKKGALKKEDKKYTFQIGDDLKIKPMIPIEDEYQDIENGILKRTDIKKMCDDVLEQIRTEIFIV